MKTIPIRGLPAATAVTLNAGTRRAAAAPDADDQGAVDDRDDREALSRSSLAPFVTALSLRFDLSFETVDAIADAAAIRFEFGFTGAASADTTRQTRECRILTGY